MIDLSEFLYPKSLPKGYIICYNFGAFKELFSFNPLINI
jgi:hypothetical protein